MKSIIFKTKSKRGMALPGVIIICTILLMMLVPLLNLSTQQLRVTKSQLNIGNSYLATGTATEKAVKAIRDYISSKKYANPIFVDDNGNQYVNNILNYSGSDSLKSLIEIAIGTETDIGISNKAKSKLKNLFQVGNVKDNGDKFLVTLGFVITSSIQKGINTSSGSDIYSQVVFEIEKGGQFFRPGAINGIGDLYVTGYVNSVTDDVTEMKAFVKGDVKIVGTAPQKSTQAEQDRYGGIYATHKGKLTISGNAFARAFIRCGDTSEKSYNNYMSPPITNLSGDLSDIEIQKNAVAQCLQIFGHNDSILVHNDAYTFDDVEMNGLNSIIAINRSLFGLSNPNTASKESHDASSAIVNSSVVHYPDEESIGEAMRSKIVINGNVMLNGGTFWINPISGKPQYPYVDNSNPGQAQIEDASNAWNEIDELPTYKNFEYPLNTDYNFKSGCTIDDPDYIQGSWLYDQYTKGLAKGYGNFIQCWIPSGTPSGVKNWFNKIRNANTDYKEFNTTNFIKSMPTGFTINNPIKGFSHFQMAANGTMYFMDKYSKSRPDKYIDEADTDLLTFSRGELNKSWYYLDSTSKKFNGTDFISWWTTDTNGVWNNQTYTNYAERVKLLMDGINLKLQKITEDFITREYVYADGKIKNRPVHKKNDTSKTLFNYYWEEMDKCNSNGSDQVLVDSEITSNCSLSGGAYQVSDYISTLDPTKSKFYLVVVKDPDITIEINDEINAIVCTRGKVVLTNGGKLNGFILAAGKGTIGSAADQYPDPDEPTKFLSRMPSVNDIGSNIGSLDSGEFASVVFKGTGGTNDSATVNFELNTLNEDVNNDLNIDQDDNLLFLINKYPAAIQSKLKELFYAQN